MFSKSRSFDLREDFKVSFTDGLAGSQVKSFAELPVAVQIMTFQILEKNHLWAVIQDGLEPSLAITESLLDFFASGKIHEAAPAPQELPSLISDGSRTEQDW